VNVALIGSNFPTLMLYAASFVVVIWAVVDVARRSSMDLPPRRKAAWIIGSLAGWLLFGVVGAVIAILYLVGPRRKMNSLRR
jgi:hypothetical protein